MLRIPIQDTRSDGRNRWTDMLVLKLIRYAELKDLIQRCDALDHRELMELQEMVRRRLENFRIDDEA